MAEIVQKGLVSELCRWQPPLAATPYVEVGAITAEHRHAIKLYLERRGKPGNRGLHNSVAERTALHRLVQPVYDALDIIGGKPADRNATAAVLLRECLTAQATFWTWNAQEWIAVLGRTSREFRSRNRPHVSQSVRLNVAAVAYLHGWFRDVLALGHFKRMDLARRVFGAEAVKSAAKQIAEPLSRWGYAAGSSLLSCMCEALLRNESPCLDHLTGEILDGLRRDSYASKRALYYQLAKVLAAQGFIDAQLSVAPARSDVVRQDISSDGHPEWSKWIEQWTRTSTIASRDNLRLHLYKAGRWLATHHPQVVTPAQWTRELAAQYVAAVARMRVGDYLTRKVASPRAGQALSPRSMGAELVALRTFFWDCQEWGWIPRRFDPSRSLALPRSIKALIGRNPRVIADGVWARLLWAGLHLEAADLPRAGRDGIRGYAYPLEYVRALALVWLFAGLRSDEISRLRIGCVRWQCVEGDTETKPVCLLDVPTNKTGSCFTKPVDPQVGRAIEVWESSRPAQPLYTDRKTGERVDLLFMYRARAMRREIINQSVIPILCRKAGVPTRDVRGSITSHRARATIASQLFNSREPMSLFELQAWLGHGSPASTQHYVAITPTKLAKAYTDAGYFERNVRAIEVLIDQDAMKHAIAAGEPWRYYDLGHGLCAYEFFDQCAHRMACARCDFYRPRTSSLVQLLEAKTNILRFLQEIPLTDEERAVVNGDLTAIERLTTNLADRPTPSGQTPAHLQASLGLPCCRGLTGDST